MKVNDAKLRDVAPDVIAMLDRVVTMLNDGTIDQFRPAPAYARRDLLTDEIIDNVLKAFDAYLQSEIDKFPGYHYPQQGVAIGEAKLIVPGFATMPPAAKRATVELYDEIMQAARADGPTPAPTSDDGYL